MMCSIYFTSDCLEMENYPTIPYSTIKETKLAFQSRVVDLKLRRASDKAQEIQDHFNTNLFKKNDSNLQQNQNEKNPNTNIDDSFINAPVPRLQNYKYWTLIDNEKFIPKNPSKCLDFRKIAKEQTARLNNAKENGINRAKRRAERMKMGDKTISNSTINEKYYMHSENSESNV